MKTLFLAIFFILLPTAVLGECMCDSFDRDNSWALKYKGAAMAFSFMTAAVSICLPVAESLKKNYFFVVKAFAAGVILATGFFHLLPDALESLTSPCMGESRWEDFRFTGFIPMVAAIGSLLMVQSYVTPNYLGRLGATFEVSGNIVQEKKAISGHVKDEHAHARRTLIESISQSLVAVLGIFVHSAIIGIALGSSENPSTIVSLIVALTFHQIFLCIGVRGFISQEVLNMWDEDTTIPIFFAVGGSSGIITGIVIGTEITHFHNVTNQTVLIVQRVFNSASAGILIYKALVDLLAADFMRPRFRCNVKLQLATNMSVLLGAGLMASRQVGLTLLFCLFIFVFVIIVEN